MLSVRERAGYGIGGALFSVKEAAYAVFVLIFYTQVLGLSGAATGLVLFLAVVFDAISDPIIGAWSDGLRSRWGRRHPFMLIAVIPLGFGMIGLFSPPAAVIEDQFLLGSWLLFWSVWIRTFLSAFLIPHLALSAEISTDYHERSSLIGMRMFFVFIVTVMIPALLLPTLFAETDGIDGRFLQNNYPIYGLISCVLIWLLGLTCTWSTRGHAKPTDRGQAPDQPAGIGEFLRDFSMTLRNRNFRNLLCFEIAAMVSYGALVSINVLVWTYFFEINSESMAILLAVPSLVGVAVALPIMNWLGKRWPKHKIIQVACVLMAFDAVWVMAAYYWGWLPENGDPMVTAAVVLQMVGWMFLFILRTISTFSLIADITDEHDLEQGRRQEGAFFAAFAFTSKLATGFGPLFGGLLLDLAQLEQGMLPGTVEQTSLDIIGIGGLLGITLPLLVAWYFSFQVSLSQERLIEIQTGIARRAGNTP